MGKELPVWQSPKYLEAKKKAIEIIESNKYGVDDSDFWILMNATKSGKMMYTGLIISHNGCLKINDCLESKFNPDCVSYDKDGYNGSLVFSYCNAEQGIYEVGEVSKSNCKNDYPYAMAYKRLFDRVVLKLSKLAYSGIYSDSESDEFMQRVDAGEAAQGDFSQQGENIPIDRESPLTKPPVSSQNTLRCNRCGKDIDERVYDFSIKRYNQPLCRDCQRKV
jgi:hypothetical protein